MKLGTFHFECNLLVLPTNIRLGWNFLRLSLIIGYHKQVRMCEVCFGRHRLGRHSVLADTVYWPTQMLADIYALTDHFVSQSPPLL
jgi:hypothetical protein